MLSTRSLLILCIFLIPAAFLACGGDDSSNDSSATPSSTSGGQTDGTSAVRLVPPLEGPERLPYTGQQQDFRQNPEYKLPSPNDVPAPTDTEDPILNPPAQPDCPSDWQDFQRPTEGFEICHPSDWVVATDGYKNAPNESRWYAAGIFKFADNARTQQLAHVSMYVIPTFARPFPYTKECPEPYSVTLDGQPAVVCPSFRAVSPEARIISYHVFRLDHDYFFNITTYFKYDESSGTYSDETDRDALDTAVKIIGSVKFTDILGGTPTPAGASATAGQ